MSRLFFGMLLLCCTAIGAFAQQPVIFEDVNADTLLGEDGPNSKNFWHGYTSYNLAALPTEGEGGDVVIGPSGLYVIGVRYKRKLTNWLAMGASLNVSSVNYRLKQDSLTKILPNNIIHKKENIHLNSLNLEPYIRINFGKRGNTLGTFIDVGGYGEWVYGSRHSTRDKHEVANSSGASITESDHKGLVWLEPFNYGASLRIGWKQFSLYGRYRFSNMIKSNSVYPELPRLFVGFELALILPD